MHNISSICKISRYSDHSNAWFTSNSKVMSMEFEDTISEDFVAFVLISISKHTNMDSHDQRNFVIGTTTGTQSKSDTKCYVGVCFRVIQDKVILKLNRFALAVPKPDVLKKIIFQRRF